MMLSILVFAALLACNNVIALDSNAARFKRGLPPLPPVRKWMGHHRRAYPSAVPVPDVYITGIIVQLASDVTPTQQFSNVIDSTFYDYALVDFGSRPGLGGVFTYSGYYSTTNRRPLYFFQPDNAPVAFPFMVLSFPSSTSTVDDPEGAYFTQAKAGNSPYPPSDTYQSVDIYYTFSEGKLQASKALGEGMTKCDVIAAVYQIDKSNPLAPILTFVTLDSANAEHISPLCIDGLNGPTQLPYLYTSCTPSNQATAILQLL